MATTQDWVASGFTAFAGPAVLNANFMAKTMNNGVEDVLADVLRVSTADNSTVSTNLRPWLTSSP